MSRPTATYRLQFRCGMDFARAAELAPYLARLGVSHLYASPIFQAMPGSSHGYDVTDHNSFDDSLGGMEGFLELSRALEAEGLGLVVDIVPNHMAASAANPWWRDVLRHGRNSRFAGHFDVDWSQPKLILPVLGEPYGAALEAGAFTLGRDGGELVWCYHDHVFPLDPEIEDVIGPAPTDEQLAELVGDHALMHRIHELQCWRLAYWRAARDMLTHRRFFEISELVGVRVEDPAVFADVHRLAFEMIAAGRIDGLRIDHVDGLADPSGYLAMLRSATPRDVPIWVEKILSPGERLPEDWPVAGATGYEFAADAGAVLTAPGAADALDPAWSACPGSVADYPSALAAAKAEILTRNLAAELGVLVNLAFAATRDDLSARDRGSDSLRRAIIALACAMPVYRSYFGPRPAPPGEREQLDRVAAQARQDPAFDDPAVVDVVAALLAAPDGAAARTFAARFQQTTGALMAKAVEDTLFYRFNRLISANEVGGEPEPLGLALPDFHRRMVERAELLAEGLSATATHDTKRGEDARMRIVAISEEPQRWLRAVARFEAVLAGPEAPEGATRWLFYQALLGGWQSDPPDRLADRLAAFMLKAAREAKLATSWVAPDAGYERRLEAFVYRALDTAAFLDDFAATAGRLITIGERKSLVQLALKLTAPGVPDIYQGTEFADLSFVDPDNRRPVDFAARQWALEDDGHAPSAFDRRKLALMRFVLDLRRSHPEAFAGSYRPLTVPATWPARTLAFVREGGGAAVTVVGDLSGGSAVPGEAADASWALPAAGARLARSFAAEAAERQDVVADLRAVSVSIAVHETG